MTSALLDAAGPARAGEGPARLDAVNVSAWFGENKVLERVNLTMPAATAGAPRQPLNLSGATTIFTGTGL